MTTQSGGEYVQHDALGKTRCWRRYRQWITSLVISLGFVTTCYGAGGDIIWQSGDSRTGKQESKAMAVDSLGNVIVTGYQNINGGADDDYLTVKFKADGSGVAWRATYDSSGGADQATAVAVDANNDVIVTGFTWNGLNFDIHTVKYSGNSGALLWQHTYSGAAGGDDHATSIAIDTLDNIYVGGYSQGEAGDDDFLVLKYGPSGGAPVWQAGYSGTAAGNDQLMSVTAGSDGIAVTGQAWNGTSFDLLTVKYDYGGTQLWMKNHSPGDAMGKKVRMDAAGNVIVTGFATNATIKEIYTVKYRGSDGILLWDRSYGAGYENDANGLTVDAAGDAYVTGYTWTLEGKENYYTARYGGAT
ncbi:MAG TPA: SBBP repeat-containing protein, partial [Geobacteraceae bacterium]|nr:SBBP repeat-containing protein [Geobacteraceae bacterium]